MENTLDEIIKEIIKQLNFNHLKEIFQVFKLQYFILILIEFSLVETR